MQTTTIRKWGNSYAVRLPKKSIDKFDLYEGQAVRIEESDNGRAISLVPATQRSASLAQLVSTITKSNRHPATAWGHSVGKEAW